MTKATTTKANTNVLAGMACPECGWTEQFHIEVSAMATVTDGGFDEMSDASYEGDAWAACDAEDCDWEGTVAQLYGTVTTPRVGCVSGPS